MHPIFMHLFCFVWISCENSKQGNRCKFYLEEIKWYSCENLVCYVSKNIYLTTLNLKFFYMQEYFSHEILMLTFYMAQFAVKYDFNSVYYNQQFHWHFWGLYTGTQANTVCDIKNANSWFLYPYKKYQRNNKKNHKVMNHYIYFYQLLASPQ